MHFDLSLLDVITAVPIIVKRHFTAATFFSYVLWGGRIYMAFSPDTHYFAISNAQDFFAWDLKTRLPVKVSSAVRDIMTGGFAFDSPDDVVGINARNPCKSGSAKFPSGPAGPSIPLYRQALVAPTAGGGILVRPAGDRAVALIDLKTGKSPLVSQMSALDVYNNVYARSEPDGGIGIYDLSTRKPIARAEMSAHWIGNLLSAEVSPDLKWFAASGRTRGAVWNLARGDRVFHVRGFSACAFSPQDNLYADFPAHGNDKRSLGILNPATDTIQSGAKLDDENVQIAQVGTYLLYGKREKGKWNGPLDFEVHDIATGATLWTKRFSNGAPDVGISPSGGEFTFVLPFTSDAAKSAEEQDAALTAESKRISDKNTARLVQIINPSDGKLRAEFAVDTGGGSFRIRQVLPVGKWAVLADTDNRALVYSLDGELRGSFFGTRAAVSDAGGFLALESEPGTLSIYDLATLQKSEDLSFGMPLAFYQFVGDGSKLLAVTDDQTAYLLSVSQPAGRQNENRADRR